jgi:hypothetical protein
MIAKGHVLVAKTHQRGSAMASSAIGIDCRGDHGRSISGSEWRIA